MAYVITSVINSYQNILTNCLPGILALTEFGLSKASDYHCFLVGAPFFKTNKAMLSHGATLRQGSARLACKSTQ